MRQQVFNLAERTDGGHISLVVSDELFHPDHIIPAAELVTALVKFTHQPVAQMEMKVGAVSGKILIFSPYLHR